MTTRRWFPRAASALEVPLGVESALPQTEQPRLARLDEERTRHGLFGRALSWLKNPRRRSAS